MWGIKVFCGALIVFGAISLMMLGTHGSAAINGVAGMILGLILFGAFFAVLLYAVKKAGG